ncbi:MAG: PQQ-binding-like beta-propeller repeat protein [Fuerstiella sp.]|nr:alcohol dehydrogenase [Fuerstiella sp.]
MRFLLLSAVLVALSVSSQAGDWPQFLGPHRTGVSDETGLIDSFPASGPAVRWRVPLGVGMSGLAIHDGLAFTMYQDADNQFVVALDATSGEQKWTTIVAAAYTNSMGNGPRATPTVHNGVVYSFSGEGILTALQANSGDVVWSVNTPKQLKGRPAEYGIASSPLIAGGSVVVQVGAPNGTVVAFDLKTGDQKWTAGQGTSGYSSPALLTLAGKQQVVAFVGAAVLGIDPANGDQLWRYPYGTDYDCNIATPLLIDDASVLISSGENHGSTILKILKNGAQFRAAPSWSSLGKKSVLRAEWQTPALADGHLFALDNLGSAGPITNLVCVRIADGEQVWAKTRFGKSNLTLADGKLFISTMKGELIIVKASTVDFTETARASVLEKMTRQAPVISNGLLYLRDDREVVCLDIRAEK